MIHDDELDRALIASNPLPATSPLPAAAVQRRAATLKEILEMSATELSPEHLDQRPPHRGRWLVAGGVVAAALAVAVVIAASNDDGDVAVAPSTQVTQGSTEVVSPGIGFCVEFYDLETLKNREVAFDGTVASIDGEEITFDVSEWFSGDSGPTVTLHGNGMTEAAVTSAGGPQLLVGQRYLVAGDAGFAWSCGFTQNYDAGTAAAWRAAFAG